MTLKQCILHTLSASLLLCCFAGCAREPAASESALTLYKVEADRLIAPEYGEVDSAAATTAAGANAFAFRLSGQLLKECGDENFVCSPYSVWLPLAALLNATDDAATPALLDALEAAGISTGDVNRAASRMLYDLTKEREREYDSELHNPLQIANAVFVDSDVTLRREFAQSFANYYRGQAINVDFADNSAVVLVNQWASEHTDGLITDIVQQFDPNTVAAIANAIYFSDRWDWEFDPEKTTEDVFHAPGGDSAAHFMLREGDSLRYYEDDHLQAMPLDFKLGGELYILLPKDGDAKKLMTAMDEAYFTKIRTDSTFATGKLLLPKFRIESGVMSLKESLTALGVPLFSEQAAPLTAGLLQEDVPVWLSDAVQKAVIEVDEKGTTAAAVTMMMAEAGAAMPEPTAPFTMVCDRPFVFLLTDYTYDGGAQILFSGVVNQPE